MSRRVTAPQPKATSTSSRSTDTSTEPTHNSKSESNSTSTKRREPSHAVDYAAISEMSFTEYQRMFNAIYDEYFHSRKITGPSAKLIAARLVSIPEFDKLTSNKQLQRYISLLDGRIIMHEVPDCPHGEVIGHITTSIIRQLGVGTPGAIMVFESDNGILLSSSLLTSVDVILDNISKKRPDTSFRIPNRFLPTPPPAWMKFLPNGKTYPNIVVEVAVQNEYLSRGDH